MDDEFFNRVGTAPAIHVHGCPHMMFPEDGILCPAILTSRADLQSPHMCAQCEHCYTRCDCTEPLFKGQDMICWGEEEQCPYRIILGRAVEDAYIDSDQMDRALQRIIDKDEQDG